MPKLKRCWKDGVRGWKCDDGECYLGVAGREQARKEVYAKLEEEARAKQTIAGTFVVTDDVKPALIDEVVTTPTDDVEDLVYPETYITELELALEAEDVDNNDLFDEYEDIRK